jgi:hypothetical protein
MSEEESKTDMSMTPESVEDRVKEIHQKIDYMSSWKKLDVDGNRCPLMVFKAMLVVFSNEDIIQHKDEINRWLKDVLYLPPEHFREMWEKLLTLAVSMSTNLDAGKEEMAKDIFSGKR